MKNTVLIIFIFVSNIAISQGNKIIDWNTDIDFIKNELPKNHYNFYMVKSEQDFFKGLDQIAEQQNQLSNFEMAVKLQQLIASFGDSHTELSWQQFIDKNKILPLQVMWFSDGIYAVAIVKDHIDVLGCKLLKINDIPIQTIIDSLSTLITVDNNAAIKNTFPNQLPYFQLLEHFFNFKPDSIILQVETQNGDILNSGIKLAQIDRNNAVLIKRDSVALCNQNKKEFFTDNILKKDNIYYIQYNQCASRERPPAGFKGNPEQLPSFNEFQKKVIETINSNDFSKVIFDIRFNSGGSSGLGTELISKLSSIEKINKKGKLYVVIGRATFSSAIINTLDFKKMTKAIFVGEETSGKPNHFGNLKYLKLPSSGLLLYYSTEYFTLIKKDIKTITPDHIVETSFNDFKVGRDPIYEWIIKQ